MSEVTMIYQEIAKIVVGFGPEDAKSLIYTFVVQAEGTDKEGAVYRHEFDYINKNNELNWFGEERLAVTGLLTPLALQLRSHIESQSNAKWKSMEFVIDMEKRSFEAKFSYD